MRTALDRSVPVWYGQGSDTHETQQRHRRPYKHGRNNKRMQKVLLIVTVVGTMSPDQVGGRVEEETETAREEPTAS